MNELLNPFIESLRDELKNFGELLALLDQQQQLVTQQHGTDLLPSVAAVDGQSAILQAARQTRDQLRRELAARLGLEPDTGLPELVPHLPSDYQPLVRALVQENEELQLRVRQRARQNHLLLSQKVELMQRLMSTYSPKPTTEGADPGQAQPKHSIQEVKG